MAKEIVDLKQIFEDVVMKSGDYKSEMNRLYDIEERCKGKFETLKEIITGLEKSLDYSGICTEAKRSITEQLVFTKKQANFFCYILGTNELYKDVK